VPQTALYRLRIYGDRTTGSRVWLNDELILEHPAASRQDRTELSLTEGELLDLRMEYWASGHEERRFRLDWSINGRWWVAVPAEVFQPPADVPRVAVVMPQAGAVVEADNIVMRAAVAVEEGEIEEIEFIAGNTVLGTATAPPYELRLEQVHSSNIELSARATTRAGGVVTSPAVNFIVEGVSSDGLDGAWSKPPCAMARGIGKSSLTQHSIGDSSPKN
jgi:hypothetical protein